MKTQGTASDPMLVRELRTWAEPLLQSSGIRRIEVDILASALQDWVNDSLVSCESFRGRFRDKRAVVVRLSDDRLLTQDGGTYVPSFAAFAALYVSGNKRASNLRIALDAILSRARSLLKANADDTAVDAARFFQPLLEGGYSQGTLDRAVLLLRDASVGLTIGTLPDGGRLLSLRDEIFEFPTALVAIQKAVALHFGRPRGHFISLGSTTDELSHYQLRRLAIAPNALTEAKKAIDRLHSDPGAAVTSARSLLESVFKWISHEESLTIPAGASLSQSFSHCKGALLLDHTATTNLARALFTVCESLGTMRNDLGDAHGLKPGQRRATVAEAQLAVSAATAAAAFLLERYEARLQARS